MTVEFGIKTRNKVAIGTTGARAVVGRVDALQYIPDGQEFYLAGELISDLHRCGRSGLRYRLQGGGEPRERTVTVWIAGPDAALPEALSAISTGELLAVRRVSGALTAKLDAPRLPRPRDIPGISPA